MHSGFIDAELIRRQVPDFKERTFYLSGPHAMVVLFKRTLRDMGVPRFRIKTDFFPGLA
jgi:ferredoxin-NADP reductase